MSHSGRQLAISLMRIQETQNTIQGPPSPLHVPQNGQSVAATTLPNLPVGSQIAIGPRGQMQGPPVRFCIKQVRAR
jgi:hypothetical protein